MNLLKKLKNINPAYRDTIAILSIAVFTIAMLVNSLRNSAASGEYCTFVENADFVSVDVNNRTEEEMNESWEVCLKKVMDHKTSVNN